MPAPADERPYLMPANGTKRTCRGRARLSALRCKADRIGNSNRSCEALVAAQNGRLRPFSGPDLSETHGLQCRRLSVRSGEVVFENACVGASCRNTADQQVGARRRAGCSDPCAGKSIEWLEAGHLAEVGAMAVLQRALQIDCRATIQRGAARKDLYRTLVRELTHDNALGAAERAGQPTCGERNAAPIFLAERNERG